MHHTTIDGTGDRSPAARASVGGDRWPRVRPGLPPMAFTSLQEAVAEASARGSAAMTGAAELARRHGLRSVGGPVRVARQVPGLPLHRRAGG